MARSYKKELILVANSLDKVRSLVQLIANLESLGYGHVLLLSYGRKDCEGLIGEMPQMGCVWTQFTFDKGSGMEARFVLWFLRYRTLIRAVRLGYNVLMTDNDVVFFEDPYPYFMSPPFDSFTVINQQVR